MLKIPILAVDEDCFRWIRDRDRDVEDIRFAGALKLQGHFVPCTKYVLDLPAYGSYEIHAETLSQMVIDQMKVPAHAR